MPQRRARRNKPLHTALEALERVRAVEEPRRARVLRIRHRLAAAGPARVLERADLRVRERVRGRRRAGAEAQERAREVHRERGVLVLVRAGEAELHVCEARERGDDLEVGRLCAGCQVRSGRGAGGERTSRSAARCLRTAMPSSGCSTVSAGAPGCGT